MIIPPSSQSHLVPGFRFDRYELLYPLAQGGMATVWVARLVGKHGFEKLVAVKTVLPQYADDADFQSMFLDEARIAARIRHPNVAEILDVGEEEDTTFLVMEWVEGDSLAKLYNALIRAGQRFPVPLLLRIAADACAGLHAAHMLADDQGRPLGVVHRDVSPQNILIGVNGVTKIIDFGVAKAAQRMTAETSAGLVKGKIQYASPEQAMGRAIDGRSDVWAVGTVMYQMLAGCLPYDGDNQLATLHMITAGQPPRALPPWVPKPVSDAVMRALSHDPARRFGSAEDMSKALEALRPASTADVSKVMTQFLGDRADARRRDVAEALASVNAGRARNLAVNTPSRPSAAVAWSAPGTPAPASPGPLPPPRAPSPSRPGLGMTMPLAAMTPQAVAPQQMFAPPPAAIAAAVAPASARAEVPDAPYVDPSVSGMRPVHYVVGAAATALTLGVWGFALTVLLSSPREATASVAAAPPPPSAAAPAQSSAPVTAPAAPSATTAQAATAAPPATTPAAPPPAAPPPTAAPAAPAAPATTKASPVAAAPAATHAAPTAAPPKKKKKVDDGFLPPAHARDAVDRAVVVAVVRRSDRGAEEGGAQPDGRGPRAARGEEAP